jgi:predicted transcriptional regulator
MKVAISVPNELFERADDVAARLGLSRSQVYARAVEQFLDAQGEDPVTAQLNELADDVEPALGSTAARRLIDSGQWEW